LSATSTGENSDDPHARDDAAAGGGAHVRRLDTADALRHALGQRRQQVAPRPTAATGPPVDFTRGWTWTLPLLIVLPNALYAFVLLRRVRNGTRLSTD
jgi:hypothetical protein